MYEDANDVMVPDSVVLREVYHTFHFGVAETVAELFSDEWDGVTGPINAALDLEPIDNDPTINALLATENL
jgi:hypothetical protein